MAAMKQGTKDIFNYVKAHENENITADDVAEALGISKKSVVGSFNSFCREAKKWGYREDDERETEDGKHEKVKYLRLTELGRSIDPDNLPE